MSIDALDTAIEEWEAGQADLKRGVLDIMKRQRDQILILTAKVEELRALLAQAFEQRHTTVVPAAVGAPVTDTPAVPLYVHTPVVAEPSPTPKGKLIGIVDPFLTAIVEREQRFWMFLYPQTITSLRHDWTHPAFEVATIVATAGGKAASEAWLRDFCSTHDCPGYDTVMAAIAGTLPGSEGYGDRWGYIDDEYFHFSGWDAHSDIPPEFWQHAEVVLGRTLRDKPPSFSCSC